VVVTTTIAGDVVENLVGDLADVTVIMPVGASPHDFAPSAAQAEAMESADLLVVNGAGFEEGMAKVVDSVQAAGTPVFALADHVDLLGADPHLWTDPVRMAAAATALGARLAELPGVDTGRLGSQVSRYVAELADLDREIEQIVSAIPAADRKLVTNHEVFAYFADRYGFEVVGAVVPSLTTDAEPSARDVEELAELMRAEGVRALFAETTQSTRLAEALADQVGDDVQVIELYAESLGEPGSGAETYSGMMRLNARLVATALGG
jgi:zinc/manganese transport system substrate-binding protein